MPRVCCEDAHLRYCHYAPLLVYIQCVLCCTHEMRACVAVMFFAVGYILIVRNIAVRWRVKQVNQSGEKRSQIYNYKEKHHDTRHKCAVSFNLSRIK